MIERELEMRIREHAQTGEPLLSEDKGGSRRSSLIKVKNTVSQEIRELEF